MKEIEEMNAKEKMQEMIYDWLDEIEDIESELAVKRPNIKEYHVLKQEQADLNGRIYGAMWFGKILGFKFDINALRFEEGV